MPEAQVRKERPDMAWPLYFAKRPIRGARISIEKGQLFPLQDKAFIKGVGGAAGCKDSWARHFADLPYVETLNVHTEALARAIHDQGLDIGKARELVEGSHG
jgi:hypothetical protein